METMKRLFKIIGKAFLVLIGLLVILFITFYLLTMGDYNVAQTAEQDPSIPHIKIGNTIFHSETFGNDTNEVVIVIHGGPGNDYRYLLPLKELSDDYYVVFYDQRGTGLSPRVPAYQHSLEQSLQDLHDIINYYANSKKVNLIGHSWGAMLASGYIGQHPENINKAVLAEPGLLTTEKAKEFIKKFTSKPSFKMIVHIAKTWFQSLHIDNPDDQAGEDYFFLNLALSDDTEGNPMAGYFCNKDISTASLDHWRFSWIASREIFMKAMSDIENIEIDLVKGVENFKDKVLFISGECNEIIGVEYQKDHMKYFANAEMVIIKNAGHTMFGEQPQESIAAVRKYFNEK